MICRLLLPVTPVSVNPELQPALPLGEPVIVNWPPPEEGSGSVTAMFASWKAELLVNVTVSGKDVAAGTTLGEKALLTCSGA